MNAESHLYGLYLAKASAELDRADDRVPETGSVAWSGSPFGRVMLVKAPPGAEDVRQAKALAGPDGEAALKALEALGFDPDSVFATVAGASESDAEADRLALQIEAVDPAVIVALDRGAASLVASVAALGELDFGRPVTWKGRTLVAVDGLEASLSDPSGKQRVWDQLRVLRGVAPAHGKGD